MRGRAGATLMEVLISIMIMAIGIIGVATLFPISLIHAVKAHQLTSGTIHRYNAEAVIDAYQYMYRDPDGDTDEAEHDNEVFVFDPIGLQELANQGGNQFGEPPVLPRYGNVPAPLTPTDLCTAPDTWVERFRGFTGADPDPADNDGDGMGELIVRELGAAGITPDQSGNFPNTRALFFYEDQISGAIKSVTRQVRGVNGDTLLFDPLAGFTSPVNEVRIETWEPRFSWMLTVIRSDAMGVAPTIRREATVYVAIFFNRAPNRLEGERTVSAVFQKDEPSVTIRWTGAQPPLKKGRYILDATNGHWYRIADFIDPKGGTSTTLTLQSPALADGTIGVLMEGVVDVFRLQPEIPRVWWE